MESKCGLLLERTDFYLIDIYCGKGSNAYSSNQEVRLLKCALGSRVVMQMAQGLLTSVVPRKINQYRLYFDNFFTSPDLLVHLMKVGLKATGAVRSNRVKATNDVDKKAERGTYSVQHKKNSEVNFITVMDSKPVSLLSTAAGVTPLSTVKRFIAAKKAKTDLPFPKAFTLYNKYMGGVDLHDAHCSNLMPRIRAKKWTWPVLLRLIQSSLANATVLRNAASVEKKIGTKDIGLEVAEFYLAKGKQTKKKLHAIVTTTSKKNCYNFKKCDARTQSMCKDCNEYVCVNCYKSHTTM